MRITVDTEEDFKLMREIYDRLYEEDEIIDLKDVVKLLDDNPELKNINANVKMSDINKYSTSLKKKLLPSLKVGNSNNKNKMRIVFRCDSSSDIGLGHVVRCLSVAKELKSHNVVFASAEDPTNSLINEACFELFLKDDDEAEETFLTRMSTVLEPDVIAIDKKYLYQSTFLNRFRQNKSNKKIVMIDNICEGMSAADEIIFPTAHLDKKLLRKYLSQKQIDHVKTGPEYVILRDEILALKDQISHNLHTPPNIVVTTGGTDPEGVLLRLIPWLKDMNLDANVILLVGQAFKFKDELDNLIGDLPDNFSVMPYSLQELIKGDLVICTFGVSIYEMIYLQIPTICISHSLENANGAKILKERYGVIEDMGHVDNIDTGMLFMTISRLLTDKESYSNLSKRCDSLIGEDGAVRLEQVIVGSG